MKFLESTSFFLRVIIFDFKSRNKNVKLKFRLVPMFHIGTEEYYEEIAMNIKECDEIFFEGISLTDDKLHKRLSLKNMDLTFKQYKTMANKLDLVTQSESLKLNEFADKLTHCDFDEETGGEAWGDLGFIEKLKLAFLLPIVLFVSHQGITRKRLAKRYMTSSEDAYLAYGPAEDEKGTSMNFIMNEREQIIFEQIRKRMETESNVEKTIGIVYGAGHMKKIARFLMDTFNYFPTGGTFIKVFDVNY